MGYYKYYVDPYATYDKSLKTWEQNSTIWFEEKIKTAIKDTDQLISMLSSLQGMVADETKESLQSEISSLGILKNNVSENLKGALDQLGNLKPKVSELKTEEDTLIATEADLKSTENQHVSKTRKEFRKTKEYPEGYSVNVANEPNYSNWLSRLNSLRNEVTAKDSSCQSIQSVCDQYISYIQKYNESVDNLTLHSSFISEAFNIENFNDLSIEEKEKIIQDFIDSMIATYDEINDNYLKCPEDFYKFNAIIAELGIYVGTTYIPDHIYGEGDDFNATVMIAIMNRCEDTNVMESLNAYLKEGKSWEESGLANFGVTEEEFFDSIYFGVDIDVAKQKLTNDQKLFNDCYEAMKDRAENYDTNYKDLLMLEDSIYNWRQFKKTIKYEQIENTTDFEEYNKLAVSEEELLFLQECYGEKEGKRRYFKRHFAPTEKVFDGFNTTYLFENMSEEEQKVYAYLYNTSGREQATQYLKDMADTINKRAGALAGEDTLEWLANNPSDTKDPNFWDTLADHVNATTEGVKDGLISFGDGICDLVDPNFVKDAHDYKVSFFIQKLSSDETWRQRIGEVKAETILTAYGVGSTIGKEAIPVALNLAHAGLGNIVRIASLTGNDMESNLQAQIVNGEEPNWFSAAPAALANGLSKTAATKVFSGIKSTTWYGKVGVSALTGMTAEGINQTVDHVFLGQDYKASKIVGSALDYGAKKLPAIPKHSVASAALNSATGSLLKTGIGGEIELQSAINSSTKAVLNSIPKAFHK